MDEEHKSIFGGLKTTIFFLSFGLMSLKTWPVVGLPFSPGVFRRHDSHVMPMYDHKRSPRTASSRKLFNWRTLKGQDGYAYRGLGSQGGTS